jgi:NADPH:quinone reductase-like Zn-dependent oxidoreductase
MRALVATGNPQPPLETRDVDDPQPGPNECVVAVLRID